MSKQRFVLLGSLFVLGEILLACLSLLSAQFLLGYILESKLLGQLVGSALMIVALYVLLAFLANRLKRYEDEVAYRRFVQGYAIAAFMGLILGAFAIVYVLPKMGWASFVEGKGFDYVLADIAASIYGGALPCALLHKKDKKGGIVDGGSI